MRSGQRVLVLLCLLLTAGGFAAGGERIVIKGSTTNLPIAQLAAEEFIELHPNTSVSVQGGGSGTGIAALIDGTTDIASSSRFMRTSEWRTAVERGVLPYNWHIANDGLAIVVHPTNPVDDLTFADIRAIYTGEITNWSALGGPDLRIVAVSRDTASGTFGSFREMVLEGKEVRAPGALFQPSNAAVEGAVADTQGAIGYIGLGYLNPRVKAVNVAATDSDAYVEPLLDTVVAGTYPLARSLFMITNDFPSGAALDFIMFVLSDRGQRLVEQAGYVPIRALDS
ncbi:MAG: phosphate ABC transporter substrate-binding protein [Candidatus Bipolaricaulota bacterium]